MHLPDHPHTLSMSTRFTIHVFRVSQSQKETSANSDHFENHLVRNVTDTGIVVVGYFGSEVEFRAGFK